MKRKIAQLVASGMLVGAMIGDSILFVKLIQNDYTLKVREYPVIAWLELIAVIVIASYGMWLLVSTFRQIKVTRNRIK